MKPVTIVINKIAKNLIAADINKIVTDFLKENPNPTDKKVHDLANKNGLPVDDVEAAIYAIASRFVTFLNSGKAVKKGISIKDIDPAELKAGIKVEREHTNGDTELATRIVLDHETEAMEWPGTDYKPLYYKEFEKWEDALKKGQKISYIP